MTRSKTDTDPGTKDADENRQAAGRIRLAVGRLAGKYPFHARVIERFVVRPYPAVPTVGVTVRGDDVLLLYNAAFVLSIRMDELVGVMLHEVHHVVFGHVLDAPADFPDRWARVVAQEVTVNEFVTEPLPATPVLLCQFPQLPPMESTRQRYERLVRLSRRVQVRLSGGGVLIAGASGDGSATVVDDHAVWAEAAADPERAGAAVRDVLVEAAADVGAVGVPPHLHAALAAMGVGHVAGNGRYQLHGSGRGTLRWVQVLRRYVGRHLRVRPDFRRPSRRCPGLVGVVPGKNRRTGRPRVMAVIDTSGSVTPRLLEQISAELSRLAADFAVTVVECDAAVHDVYPYRPLKEVHGRGGTDFRPPLTPEFLGNHRPDLVVYFTDGFGPAPEVAPRVPVIWCLTPGGVRPAAWGRVVEIINVTAGEKSGSGHVRRRC